MFRINKNQSRGHLGYSDRCVENYRINGDVNQAAAMALYTILSIIPLFILTIIAAGYFFSSYPNISEDIIGAIRAFHPYFSEKLLTQLAQIERKNIFLAGRECLD